MPVISARRVTGLVYGPVNESRLRVAMTFEQCWHRVPGGTATAAIDLARELHRDPELDVVGVAAWHRTLPSAPFRPPTPVQRLPLPRHALYEAWHVFRRPRVERATGPVHVIHATGLAMPPRSAPIVLTVHDLTFLRHPEHFSRAGRRFFRQSMALARREADLILCSSLATLEDCRAAGFEPKRLRHVPLGVESVRAEATDVERVRRAYSLERPYVLWAGTIEPRKNLKGLIDAFGRLDNGVELVLVGPRGWKEDPLRLVDALPEHKRRRVRVLGYVPRTDLRPLYAGASVFCFPSLLEGFGFPVVEAMAQGTPVVTSRGTSTAEVSGNAGLLVEPLDSAEIAAALQRLLTDQALAERLRRAGPARAAEYTWERTARLVKEAYRELAT
jgi:glycosyltransferase involved in cell wall biosynthesis